MRLVDSVDEQRVLEDLLETSKPALPPEERSPRGYTTDRVLIDACRPFKWLDQFPAVNAFTRDYKTQVGSKYNL